MELNGMNLRQTAELLASEINIKSLLYLYSTSSDLNKITSMLLKRKLELQQFFKSDFSSDLINVLKSLVPIYNLPNELSKQKSEILSATYCEEFLESIRHYLLGVKKIQRNRSKLLEELNFIILYLDVNINQIPPSNIHYNRFWSVLKALHETLVDRGFQNENSVSWISELMQLIEKKSLYINRKNLSWRECSVYPHPVDIFESKDLVPNKTFGPYKDLSEYLDIHFKLYKEDFESNLREGLLQYKAKLRGAILKDNLELYVYNRVRVESLEVDKSAKNGVFHKITITIGNKEESNDFNKIFMNGSLLLFSQCSQFSTFILAILVDFINLPEEQRKWSKSLKVSVISDPSSLKVGHTYTMIEPKAFFEPYHQVLKVLQAIDYHNFPMTKYIVHADVSPGLPNYINFNTEYNFSGRRLKLFGNNNWPANLLKLNSQQIEALQASLTHEFVLIQGPPGTGKTYLAENIIKVLIENKHLSTPILLISSKNDSVDRILEPLAISGRKVVRLGGQSKSAVLKKCSIGNVIKRFGGREMADSINNLKDVIVRKIHANEKIDEVLNSFNREQKSFLEFREGEDARQLLSAGIEIIGGTTAGCARLRCMLDRLQPEVIIVEDANEVLEAHIIASLSKGCKHVILIGDHKQLQPNVSKDGSEMYNLDVSLLERMERCGMKCSTLTEQWRMRPEIAALLSPLVYPNLLNHPNVIRLPDVKGMKKNLFFLDHNVSEEKVVDSQGYRNKHEGDLLLGLAEYLLKQGYSNSDITILSPYTAQQNYMRQAAKSNPSTQNIEIQMIDSYSGQENMIILLSLVRSQSSAIGFLSSNNRITVALSRAKCGLYIVGNMRTLINGSQLWSSINEVLKQQNGIGKSIELKCQKHQTITTVTKAEDFKSNQGGCNMPCKSKLACGHICKLSCHSLADGHRNYKCKSPCPRLCPRQIHKCKKKCHEHCGPCNEMSERQLACGHISLIPCSKDDLDYICVSPTIVSFLCFGQLTVPCSQADSCFYSRVER